MKNGKLVRFDWAIKYLLRNKANFDVLEGFLSAVLSRDVKVLNLLESESNKQDEGDKLNRVDLLVEADSEEYILVEVQVESEIDFFHRITYGTARLIIDNMEAGNAYREIKKVITISITYFSLGRGKDYLYYGSTNFVGVHTGDMLMPSPNQKKTFGVEQVREIFPEHYAIRVENFSDQVQTDIDEWIYMLKHSKVEPEFESDHIQTASKKLNYMGLKEKDRLSYDDYMLNESYHNSMIWSSHQEGRLKGKEEGREEGMEEGLEKGREEGMEKGRKENKFKVAQIALKKGIDIETITLLTGFSTEEIVQIQQELG